jgi:Saccharopine dehydrogenase NADP binding domain
VWRYPFADPVESRLFRLSANDGQATFRRMVGNQLRILVIGGYGVFGGRLARLLAEENNVTVLVAGRSKKKAEAFCRKVSGQAILVPEFFDRDADVVGSIKGLRPDIVVDAAGPFQAYGSRPYRTVEAAMACGADYIDLSDATKFVCGIDQFDTLAREQGRVVISGASTCPALTGAVARYLATNLSSVVAIEAGIAPSPHVRVGLSVISALASYAGRPLQVLRDGKSTRAVGFVASRRHAIAPPGVGPLDERLFSLVDVPDLQLLPSAWPALRNLWFGAGTAPAIYHRMFVMLAWLSSIGLLGSLNRIAPLLHRLRELPTWGAHRGGMYVMIDGQHEDGRLVHRVWELIAEGDDGPFIPAMAAAAIIRNYLNGRRLAAGARSAVEELDYADFEHFFARKAISAGVRDLSPTAG